MPESDSSFNSSKDFHIIHMLEAPRRILPQTSRDDLFQIARHWFARRADQLWLIAQDGRDRGDLGGALKSTLSGDHLVKHAAKLTSLRASTGLPSACSGDI
jgi:hypothetical protein